MEHMLTEPRHWSACLPALSHVMLRSIESGCHSGHAYARSWSTKPTSHSQKMHTELSQTAGTLGWQVANQSLNVGINFSNANKSTPLPTSAIVQSYFTAVTASCGVALGLNALVPRLKGLSPNAQMIAGRLVPFAAVATAGVLNVFLMRGEEIRQGIDIFPALSELEKRKVDSGELEVTSLGRSKKAATLAVGETAISRILNATPIMVLPPLILVKLQKTEWLKQRPRMVTPVNLGGSTQAP
jgi:hypothetical protein